MIFFHAPGKRPLYMPISQGCDQQNLTELKSRAGHTIAHRTIVSLLKENYWWFEEHFKLMKALGAILSPVSAHVSCCVPCVCSTNYLCDFGFACQENDPGGN